MTFKPSPELDLPASATTSTFAFLGIRGYGKTYAAGVLVEDFLTAGAQVVVVDPVGVWFGLRLAAGGVNPSRFDVPVFGGSHGDLPLEPTGGDLIAQIAVETRRSMVLDVSDWTLGEQRRFVTAFATTLFQLKKKNRSPVHLVFEEAHEFFPQFVEGAAAPLVGATNRLWKIGRNYGIGGTLISQRAAEVNKSALNLTETIITTRLKAPEDVKRINGWANANGVDDKAIALLPSLPKRQVIVWTDEGARVTQFHPKETFDTSRTPEAGDAAPAPAALAPLDLVAIRKAMASTLESAQANDPRELRARIRDLERQLATAPPKINDQKVLAAVASERDTYRTQRDECREVFDELSRHHGQMWRAIRAALDAASTAPALPDEFQRLNTALPNPPEKRVSLDDLPPPPAAGVRAVMRAFTTKPVPARAPRDGSARMLIALAELHPRPLTERQLGTLAIMKPSGGTFGTYLSRLKTGGLVTRDQGLVALTAAGLAKAGPVLKPATARELLAMWREKLPGKAADMLEWLAAERCYKTKDQLADFSQLNTAGGTFDTYLSKLSANGLVQRTKGKGLRAVEELWLR